MGHVGTRWRRAPAPGPGRPGASEGVARHPERPSAQSWDQDVVAGPAVENVHAPVPMQHVVAGAANERVVGRTAEQKVVAGAAVRRQLDGPGRPACRVHGVVAVAGLDRKPVVGGLGTGNVYLAGQAEDGNAGRIPGDHDRVVAAGAVHDYVVRLAVTTRGGCPEVEVNFAGVRAGQVVDGNGVGPTQCVEVDPLHAVEVHRDVARVAGEEDMASVGGDVDFLVDVGAVENHRVM